MLTDILFRALRRSPEIQRQMKRVLVRLPSRGRRVVHMGQQLLVDPTELHGFYLYYQQEYDDYIFDFLNKRLESFARALDVGANIGVYTTFLAARISKVDAFEPEMQVLPKLRANLRLNGLSHVRIYDTCVAHVSGSVKFQRPSRVNEGIGRIVEGDGGVEYSCISLDDFFGESIREPCLIKMDIEGGEWLALQGASRVLSHPSVPVSMLLEIHPAEIASLGGSVPEVKSMLEKMGFYIYALKPSGLEPMRAGSNARFWWASSVPE